MPDNELFDFSMEIDPDYVRQIADKPDHKPKPARIKTKKAWVMSLLLPVLSILASAYPLCNGLFLFTVSVGAICGGIIPTVMIARNKLDTSKYFPGKMILFAVLVAVVVISWVTSLNVWTWIAEGLHFMILPTAMITAEIIFAAVQKTDTETKLVLALSSPAWVYLGFTLDFALCFAPLF